MQNDCQQFQESLRSNAGRIGPDGPGEHVRSCPDCQALVEALASPAVRALHTLPHLSAPAALDGMVVAALHGGHREDRVIGELEALPVMRAPAELEARVEAGLRGLDLGRRRAPAELQDLVDGELRRPRRRLLGLAAAAALLLTTALLQDALQPGDQPEYSFTVRELGGDELRRMSPTVRPLVSGWTGGLSDALAR